ncbi:hypothetical protein ACSBL2_10545 [Pedobacter sp. AW31-3R]|uniref:hypothetical protein n=1 Tax=Pedobacter sp. AW31-3R TaxID=3445781 RepID=UPI003F9F834E
MRKLLLLATLGLGVLIAAPAKAQVSVSINIGSQPQWGPTGYNHVDYYYLPEVESYYYVPSRQFIYLNGNRWIRSSRLPSRYRSYDLYHGRKVVINSPKPYLHHSNYRSRYGGYSRPSRVIVRNNYRHDNGRKVVYHGRDNHRGRDNYKVKVVRKGDHGRGHDKGGRRDRH